MGMHTSVAVHYHAYYFKTHTTVEYECITTIISTSKTRILAEVSIDQFLYHRPVMLLVQLMFQVLHAVVFEARVLNVQNEKQQGMHIIKTVGFSNVL